MPVAPFGAPPAPAQLRLREDATRGVYVENVTQEELAGASGCSRGAGSG